MDLTLVLYSAQQNVFISPSPCEATHHHRLSWLGGTEGAIISNSSMWVAKEVRK